MPVVGGAHDHRVHVIPCENLTVVPRREDIVPEPLPGLSLAAVVDIAGRYDLHARHPHRGHCVGGSHTTGTNDGDLDLVIGRVVPLSQQDRVSVSLPSG